MRVTYPPIDHLRRIRELREQAFGDSALAAIVLTDPIAIRWATGFTGGATWVIVTPGRVLLCTDPRYGERARDELDTVGTGSAVEVCSAPNRAAHVEHLRSLSADGRPLGCQARRLVHEQWEQIAQIGDLVAIDDLLARLRRVKEPAEVARIEAAADIADRALSTVADQLAGMREIDVRIELEYAMRKLGADDASYPTIVASGPSHSARPHHGAADRAIREGDLVVIDVGALVDGYHSDMTRTFVIGDPTPEQTRWYELVHRAQTAALAKVAPGLPVAELDRTCREIFAEEGLDPLFIHATGHGVGLEIHENPIHSAASDEVLIAGDVVTVEPGLYRDGFGGIRIEDLVVVTESHHRTLTKAPKD